jgi:thiol-disulfide isomerase/thioredoxin
MHLPLKSLTLLGALILPVLIQSSSLKSIKTLDEYVALSSKPAMPTVVVFNSTSCTACTLMEPGLADAQKKYAGQVTIYTLNTSDPAFKGLHAKMKELKLPKIEAYPTTHFIKKGTQLLAERGSLGDKEIDMFINRLVSTQEKRATKK